MLIRKGTNKRKGKASSRRASNSMTRAIRVMRAAFFILIGLVFVAFYFSYENGSLVEGIKSLNLAELYKSGVSYLLQNPFKLVFLLISNLLLFWAGYVIGKKRR